MKKTNNKDLLKCIEKNKKSIADMEKVYEAMPSSNLSNFITKLKVKLNDQANKLWKNK